MAQDAALAQCREECIGPKVLSAIHAVTVGVSLAANDTPAVVSRDL
jgi:hypothetical protein